jgi:hypothetical protein
VYVNIALSFFQMSHEKQPPKSDMMMAVFNCKEIKCRCNPPNGCITVVADINEEHKGYKDANRAFDQFKQDVAAYCAAMNENDADAQLEIKRLGFELLYTKSRTAAKLYGDVFDCFAHAMRVAYSRVVGGPD